MLDFDKLLSQLDGLQPEAKQEEESNRCQLALAALTEATERPLEFNNRLDADRGKTFWPLTIPLEEIGTQLRLTKAQTPYGAVAVDGSQIMPSHHEVHNCYLINIGKVAIQYGKSEEDTPPVLLESEPQLFHSSEDLYPLVDRRRLHVDEQFVSLERSLQELQTLRDLSLQIKQTCASMVAFVDGSLIPWSLDQMPQGYQLQFAIKLHNVLEAFRANRIPLIGYISHSRSSEIVNALRVWKCPFPHADCHAHCGRLHEEDYPCSAIWPTTDRQLMETFLSAHERCAAFRSSVQKGPALPEEHSSCFTYVNTGKEVARIEFPLWLFDDRQLLHEAIAIAISQAQKGGGYPVCLAESHNLAVIRASDRRKFFELVAQHLVNIGVHSVRISPKESGKRRGIV